MLRRSALAAARWNLIANNALYNAILDKQPYAVCGLLGFGANLLVGRTNVQRGRDALKALEVYAHADLFMTPTAEMADVVLPIASAFERHALKIGFDVTPEAQSLIQFRRSVVAPRGESRSDTDIVSDLACCLGLGEHFWGRRCRGRLPRPSLDLDRSRAVYCGCPDEKLTAVGRPAPAGSLGARGRGQCLVDAQAPRRLPLAEQASARIAEIGRIERTHSCPARWRSGR